MYRDLFRQALRIRMAEEKIIELYPSDKIQSPVHLSIGQEAVAVGACHALEANDIVYATYRSHAFYMAKGGDLNKMFAELYGRMDGGCKGKAGSMHLAAPEVNFMGASAVVASSLPHAAGSALAAKIQKKNQIILSVFGDGATEEGVFHETLNFAALKQLPVVFLCEDNGLAVHSPLSSRQSYHLDQIAKTYGMDVLEIENGMDFIKVYETVHKAVEQVRKGRGPVFVLVRTYRYKEHVGPGDDFDAGYREKSEYLRWAEKDPLIQDKDLFDEFRDELAQEVEGAVQFAEKSPWPEREELLNDVW